MLDNVYSKKVLALAGNIPRLGRLDHPDASATAYSRLCGSTVTVDIALERDRITDFAHDVKACALGQASSSLMAAHVIGISKSDLRDLRAKMHAMLKENGPPPDGKWAEFACLEPIREIKSRHASTLLTFDAIDHAIRNFEEGVPVDDKIDVPTRV